MALFYRRVKEAEKEQIVDDVHFLLFSSEERTFFLLEPNPLCLILK